MAPSKVQISLKVVIHKQEQRVLFAEANSEFVDVLLSFLTLPMGTIVRLLSKQSKTLGAPAIGSFNNLCRSTADLDVKYFASGACKDILQNTWNSAADECQNLKINIDDTRPVEYFTCEDINCTENGYTPCFSTYKGVQCQNCSKLLNRNACDLHKLIESIVSTDKGGVFVQPTESFVITNDLHVVPNIPASTLAILENSGSTDFGVLGEKAFKIGSTEMLNLLKYAILSKDPLTNLFFSKNQTVIDKSVETFNNPRSTEGNISFKKITVKILVQKSSKKILLAHCAEDFIDFLFSLVTVPLARVIGVLSKDDGLAPCVKNIHESVFELSVGEYLKSQEAKDMLLRPQLALLYLGSNQLFPLEEDRIQKLYRMPRNIVEQKEFDLSIYPLPSTRELNLASPVGEGGFLKESTKFMVTDDLVVTPFTSMSCIKYVQSCRVPPNDSEEQVISIGVKEAMSLLAASLGSTSVLTNGLNHLVLSKPEPERLVKKPKLDQ